MDAGSLDSYASRLAGGMDRLIRYMASAGDRFQSAAPGPIMSGSQRLVLRALVERGPVQISEVASLLDVTLSAATGLVDRLVKAKMATRDRDQSDRRVVWVKITPDGQAAVQAAEARRRMAWRQLALKLSEEDLIRFCDIMEKLG